MTHATKLSRYEKRLILGLIVLVAFGLLAIAAEGVVRARQWIKYGHLWGIEETYFTDPETGLRIPVPGSETGPIKINSMGFRGPGIKQPKPAATIRLAFLGASTTYCAEVSGNEMTWPHLVWEELSRRWPSVQFDYVNAGVPGYAVQTSVINLERRVKSLQPDVIFIYHATNDLSGNSFNLALERGLVDERTEASLSWPANHSLLWYLVEKNLQILFRQAQAHSQAGKLSFDPAELSQPFRSDLLSLVRASQEVADLVVLITFSTQLRRDQGSSQQAEAAVTSLYYMPYMSIEGLLDGFKAYNDVIRDVAAETGSLLIADEFGIPGNGMHFIDSVHFTDIGSRAMAERVTDALIRSKRFTELVLKRVGGLVRIPKNG